MSRKALRCLQCRLVWLLVFYFVAGSVSQKLIPGVDEIFPFYGWSLFSKVPAEGRTYTLRIDQHSGRKVAPPVDFPKAPGTMVQGNRYIGRKLIQKLGRALDRGEQAEADRLRTLLENNYLRGELGYAIFFERYDPLEKWRSGESLEERGVARFETGKKR